MEKEFRIMQNKSNRVLCTFVFWLVIYVAACFSPGKSVAFSEPNGPYARTCTNARMDSAGTLSTYCQNFWGNQQSASLTHAADCGKQSSPGGRSGVIWNVDGTLRCVISAHPSQSGRDQFDIVSIPFDTKTDFGETKIWRIDHPDVIDPQHSYAFISFKPGDTVRIDAGGCVQTGGSGSTWKLYTNPSGDDADHLYSGLIQIPAVIPSLVRIGGTLDYTHFIGLKLPPTVVPALYLTLGYQDDGYGDNGYYSHDNGNNNQCANVGPAYVEVTVVSTTKAADNQPNYSPHSKDYDITWDVNNDWDANGLPVNAKWGYQIDHKDQVQNFAKICGSAFSVGSWPSYNTNVDETKLASVCTSQAPTTDLTTNAFDNVFAGPFGLCESGFIPGHLNWAIGTYTGPISWNSYSGDWPQDGDYNFWLKTPNNDILTSDDPLLELEMNGGETVDNFSNPWWKTIIGSRNDTTITNAIGGHFAVITGLIGIDGAHGDGHTESHPVFSMAVRLSTTEDDSEIEETWVYFLRNSGNQGGCSHMTHSWDGVDGTSYYVSLPWPSSLVTGVKVLDSHFWKDASTNVQGAHGVYPGWTYLKFATTSNQDLLLDGQITLHYKKTPRSGTEKAKPIDPSPHNSSLEQDEPRWTDIAAKAFADPNKRKQFLQDLTAARPAAKALHRNRLLVTIEPSVKDSSPPALAARHGQLMRARETDNAEEKAQAAALVPLVDKYKASLMKPATSP